MNNTIDLDMLAVDLGDMLAKYGYADVTDAAIRPEVKGFLAAILANQSRIDDSDSEPGSDAATWSANPEPESAEPVLDYEPPKYGRVRVYPIYIFAAYDPTDPEVDEIWITDWDKAGKEAARQAALAEAAKCGGTVGRLLRKDSFRWLPYAGTPRDARPC